jgi:hypothetical protein
MGMGADMSNIQSFKVRKNLDSLNFRHKIELNMSSIAVTVEALDNILVEKGILEPGELMRRAADLARTKIEPGGDG